VNREGTLYTDLERYLTNSEGLANRFARLADNDALENLDTAAVAFNDVYVNVDGVTNAERWDV
jgi:hypothetical protein